MGILAPLIPKSSSFCVIDLFYFLFIALHCSPLVCVCVCSFYEFTVTSVSLILVHAAYLFAAFISFCL